jgi:hypothetical protein
VLDNGEYNLADPGEIQFALAIYDDPAIFQHSAFVTNPFGRLTLYDGDPVPRSRLPARVTLCIPAGRAWGFGLYGWDNDDPADDTYSQTFDDIGDDDDLLVGVEAQFAGAGEIVRTVETEDLEVRFRARMESSSERGCNPLERLPASAPYLGRYPGLRSERSQAEPGRPQQQQQ